LRAAVRFFKSHRFIGKAECGEADFAFVAYDFDDVFLVACGKAPYAGSHNTRFEDKRAHYGIFGAIEGGLVEGMAFGMVDRPEEKIEQVERMRCQVQKSAGTGDFGPHAPWKVFGI